MRNIFIAVSLILQLAVLLYMAGYREMIIMTGKTVFLRTMPVDPRDPFRGDYVSLNYEISLVSRKDVKGLYSDEKGGKFYVRLKKEDNGLYSFDGCSAEMPAKDSVFIKGRNVDWWGWGNKSRILHLKYGIEKYFVQQKRGLEIERKAGWMNEIHIPLEMEVSLGSDGTAVARGYRWSPLGIGLQVIESPVRTGWQDGTVQNPALAKDSKIRKSPKIRITLQNVSGKPLAIVNLPDFRSFAIETSEPSMKEWKFTGTPVAPVLPANENVIVLKPDEKSTFDFDFAEPRWFVEGKNGPEEIGTATNQWSDMFRFIYAPPAAEECKSLDRRDIIWHGKLQSRRFSSGRMD
ncbi:MAG: hypothetical protein A2X48_22950 [Lentisphaerae bacterium GWF2_49_21]|nr:MAG: hypothetical protein A2X48_22950 [Lentisphaerae bacterium GWF2_49_21]